MFRRCTILICAAMMLASAARCAETVKFAPKMLAVFKNGLGFFVRTSEAVPCDGTYITDFVPEATLGTFWVSSPMPSVSVDEIVAYREDVSKLVDAGTIDQLLRANIGKTVRVVRAGLDEVEGEVKSVGEAVVQIKTNTGRVIAFPKSQISSLEFAGEYSSSITEKQQEKRLKFKVKSTGLAANSRQSLTMAYLSKGITWVPSYLIDIKDPKKAWITFKSALVNDIEDFENVEVLFVVGYPNFAFSDQMSPMALQQSVTDIIRGVSAEGGSRGDYFANWATQNARYSSFGAGWAADKPAPSTIADYTTVGTPGQSEADLFLYSKNNVSLKKGERAEYMIFTASVDYEHIYEWNVDDTSGVDPYGSRVQQPGSEKLKDAVWHSLRLTNSTNYPWTTAPAFVVSGNKPLSQDELAYTSKGAKGVLKMTVATDIAVGKREDEIARNREVKIGYNMYNEVTVRGELSLTNYKNEPAKLIVKKNFTGEVLTTNPEAKVTRTAAGLAGINPRSIIEWEFTLPAGETKKLTYDCKTYVRN